MLFVNKVERVGEYLGPIDWNYDFASHGWDKGGAFNPGLINRNVDMLMQASKDPERYLVTTDGGIPRVGWKSVIRTGMYDGWPYWKPVPSIEVEGGIWYSFTLITDICVRSLDAEL